MENKLKEGFAKLMEQKQLEIEKMSRELKKTREFLNQSLERSRGQIHPQDKTHSTSQVKVVRVNNFISTSGKGGRAAATSHSPSALAAGSSKDSQGSQSIRTKAKKGLKVVSHPGKSPYLEGHFNKLGVNLQAQQSSSNSVEQSESSSAKASRKGAASAEISESSLIVLKQGSSYTTNGNITT